MGQLVQEPTGEECLLLLVIANDDGIKVRLGPKLADPHCLFCKVPDAVGVRLSVCLSVCRSVG